MEFIYCILGLTFISFVYNLEPFRLKTKPGIDMICNGLSLGILIPLAAWSVSQPILDFPRLYFFAIFCYLMALYCPTMAVDVDFDRKSGITTFATKFGAEFIFRLVPIGTHSWRKFIKPSELAKFLRQSGLCLDDLQGMVYEPLFDEWNLSRNVKINYVISAIKPV